MVKTKQYHLNNLLDDYDDIIQRCHLIEKVSNAVSFIPNTQITSNGESLKYQQDFLNFFVDKLNL